MATTDSSSTPTAESGGTTDKQPLRWPPSRSRPRGHPALDASTATGGRFSFNASSMRQNGIYFAFAAVVLLFTVLTGGDLLQPQNLSNIFIQQSYILILAIGMLLIIVAGHIDLSVGSVLAATGAFAAVLMVNHNIHWAIAIPLTLVLGGLIGAWQGYWVAYFGIPAFIVTLAGMLLFRATTMMILSNQGIGPFPDTVRSMANGFTPLVRQRGPGWSRRRRPGHPADRSGPGGRDRLDPVAGPGRTAGLRPVGRADLAFRGQGHRALGGADVHHRAAGPVQEPAWVLLLLAALVVIYSVITSRAVFGRHIYAIGGNLHAATLSGVKVKSVTFWLFVNMGVLSAVAGIIFAGRLNLAGPTAGNSFELDAIAAAFIGGAAVQGGVGKVVGAITGGLIMGVINNGMSLLGASSDRVMLVKGAVLLAAVAFDVWSKRRAGASSR